MEGGVISVSNNDDVIKTFGTLKSDFSHFELSHCHELMGLIANVRCSHAHSI